MPALTPRLLLAYRATDYRAGVACARIGARSASVDALLRGMGVREGAFVTACNPYSRPMPAGWNARAMGRIRAHARGAPRAEGVGAWRGWSEKMLLLGGAPARAAVLARRFRQHAVVAVRAGRPARLVVVSPPGAW